MAFRQPKRSSCTEHPESGRRRRPRVTQRMLTAYSGRRVRRGWADGLLATALGAPEQPGHVQLGRRTRRDAPLQLAVRAALCRRAGAAAAELPPGPRAAADGMLKPQGDGGQLGFVKASFVWDRDPQGSPSGGACMVHPRGLTPPKRSKSRPADRALRDIPLALLARRSREKGQRGLPSEASQKDAQRMPPPDARRRWEVASQSFEARARRIPYRFGCLGLRFNSCRGV